MLKRNAYQYLRLENRLHVESQHILLFPWYFNIYKLLLQFTHYKLTELNKIMVELTSIHFNFTAQICR